MIKKNLNSSYLIISFSQDFYKFHYTLTMASTLRATNRDVTVFISGYACNYIRKNWKVYDKSNINEILKKKNMGSIKEIYLYCKQLELKVFYCKTALNFLNIKENDVIDFLNIKPISMYSILNTNKKSQIIFI